MAGTYTYEQFEQAAKDSGLYNQFSSADLSLAQKNPDAGMSILKYKQDWQNATTDEMRELANAGAEKIRSSYGGYTGGGDGGSFYLDPLSPNTFSPGAAPSYSNNYQNTIDDLLNQQLNYGSFSYSKPQPAYTNRYDSAIQEKLNGILNREDFTYDPENDQLYSQYKKAYTREGNRAVSDALGAAAAASGGLPSSYAQTAAAQAGNYYASQMADKIPELYNLAYNKYMNDYNMDLSGLSAVQGAEQNDYNKYLNELAQYNTNRNFDYNAWADRYNMINNNLQTASGLEQLDYTKYLNDLAQYNTDRNFNYQQHLDEIDSQTNERKEALNNALVAADYGDYSFLNNMGINTDNNNTDWERRYNMALLAAQYGDYSGLAALGITPDMASLNNYALASSGNWADWTASSGARSGSGSGSRSRSGGGGGDSKESSQSSASVSDKVTNQVDTGDRKGTDWIRVSGYGRLTWKELESLVNKGAITESYNPETGKYTYSMNRNYKG